MITPISPGVYSQITDLSTYIESVPSTIGFIVFLSNKGRDNELIMINSRKRLINEFGTPDFDVFGAYGEGVLNADNFLKTSTSLYGIRALPSSARYANCSLYYNKALGINTFRSIDMADKDDAEIFVDNYYGGTDLTTNVKKLITSTYSEATALTELDPEDKVFVTSTATGADAAHIGQVRKVAADGLSFVLDITTTVLVNDYVKTIDDGKTYLVSTGYVVSEIDPLPLVTFYPNGRGEYYNEYRISLTPISNVNYVYQLNTYAKNSEGLYDSIEPTFEVSFRKDIKDSMGESLFIEDVLNKYANTIACKVNKEKTFDQIVTEIKTSFLSKAVSNGYDVINVKGVIDDEYTSAYHADNYVAGDLFYVCNKAVGEDYANIGKVMKVDVDGTTLVEDTTIVDFGNYVKTTDDVLYVSYGSGYLAPFDPFALNFILPISNADSATYRQFGGGTSGTLFDANGKINNSVADAALLAAYTGITDEKVIDKDNYYFSIVLDAGYSKTVTDGIVNLSSVLRKDCVSIIGNGRNKTPEREIENRRTSRTYNTYHAALYSQYRKTVNPYNGKEILVSPMYHLSNIIPYNDSVGELWFAAAGFNRGAINDINGMDYNPIQGDRDSFYLNQINPTVMFNGAYVLWGQLTTQRKPSKMQSLNVVRLVLYIDTALKAFCKYFIFEQNDSFTWNQIQRQIELFLEDIKNRRGLYSYSVEVGATEYEKKKRTMHINLELQPIEPVEKIILNFFIK